MRIYIGGAHNGKRQYVRKMIGAEADYVWAEGCKAIGDRTVWERADRLIVCGIEDFIEKTDLDEEEMIRHILLMTAGREVIFILTDFGRGIVPMEKERRALRDAAGRLYQRLFDEAEEITRIWYGIPQKLK